MAAFRLATRRFSKIIVAWKPIPEGSLRTWLKNYCIVWGEKVEASYVQRHINNIHALSAFKCRRLHGKLSD